MTGIRMSGKVCVVTGGASGIGKAVAIAILREGGRVVITDRNESLGHETKDELGENCLFVPHDVSLEDQWHSLVATVMDHFGRIDVLVNNAGISTVAGIEDETLAQWRAIQAVNVDGVFLGCKHTIPAIAKSGGGSIINVTSAVLNQPPWFNAAYSASKGAVDSFTRSVAIYCLHRGYSIRCNSVQPYATDTPLMQATLDTLFAGAPPEARGNVGLKLSKPEAVANAILFLASDESSDINGTAISLDRGAQITAAAAPRP